MLIQCQECKKEVSDYAPSCVHCGAPLKESAGAGTNLVTTQSTSKKFKLFFVLFFCTMLFSCSGVMVGAAAKPPAEGVIGFFSLLFTGSIVGLVVTKVLAWWHHG
jgi:hypothetical protein